MPRLPKAKKQASPCLVVGGNVTEPMLVHNMGPSLAARLKLTAPEMAAINKLLATHASIWLVPPQAAAPPEMTLVATLQGKRTEAVIRNVEINHGMVQFGTPRGKTMLVIQAEVVPNLSQQFGQPAGNHQHTIPEAEQAKPKRVKKPKKNPGPIVQAPSAAEMKRAAEEAEEAVDALPTDAAAGEPIDHIRIGDGPDIPTSELKVVPRRRSG